MHPFRRTKQAKVNEKDKQILAFVLTLTGLIGLSHLRRRVFSHINPGRYSPHLGKTFHLGGIFFLI